MLLVRVLPKRVMVLRGYLSYLGEFYLQELWLSEVTLRVTCESFTHESYGFARLL